MQVRVEWFKIDQIRALGFAQALGLTDRTVIVFSADNGGNMYNTVDDTTPTSNRPLRGGKATVYEGGVRGFALVQWPGKVAEKIVSSDIVHVSDMYPTLLKLAGGKLEQAKPLDGVDIWPVLAERQLSPRKEVLINVEDLRGAIRVGEWKLIVHAALPSRVELFQLSSDPEEAENRAEQNAERIKEMLAALNKYAYDMAPAKYLEDITKPHTGEIPIYWGYNPTRKQ